MKRPMSSRNRFKAMFVFASMGTLMQFGTCNIGQIPAATTIDGREALIALIRGAILTPIDAYITDTVTQLFSDE